MISLSDFKKFIKCPKLYFLGLDEHFQYLNLNFKLETILINKYQLTNYYLEDDKNRYNHLINIQNKYKYFLNLIFTYNDLQVTIPLIKKVSQNNYEIYLFCERVNINNDFILEIKIIYWLLSKLNIQIKNIIVLYVDINYCHQNDLDYHKALIETDSINKQNFLDIVIKDNFNYEKVLNKLKKAQALEYSYLSGHSCFLKKKCQLYNKCVSNNVINNQTIKKLSKLNNSRLPKDKAQIKALRNGSIFVDYKRLNHCIQKVVYPISFIDFEWDLYLIPPYNNMKPLDVLCFAFSLYVVDESGVVWDYVYVGQKDCRLEFVETLIKYLPTKGSIMAFNAQGAEKLRIKEFINYFPQYKITLENILKRILDLAYPFENGIVYDLKMSGSYTLKSILKVATNQKMSYNVIEVRNGLEAIAKWRLWQQDNKIYKDAKRDLIAYCRLDSYSMYQIWKWLLRIITDSSQ